MIDFPNSPTTGQVFTPAGGPTYVWTGVGWAIQGAGGGSVSKHVPGGRLTLTSGVPVLNINTVSQGTIYYTPYNNDQVPIFNGTAFVMQTFTEQSVTLDTTNFLSGSLYDLFMFNNAGTMTLGYGPAWTNITTRSNAIARLQGILTNSATITLRTNSTTTFSVPANQATYVGTAYGTAAGLTGMNFNPAAANGGSPNTILGIYNAYNRVPTICVSRDNVASWTYTTATWRKAHGTANNLIGFVDGVGDDAVWAAYVIATSTTTTATIAAVGINFNAASGAPLVQGLVGEGGGIAPIATATTVHGTFPPVMGYNYVQAMEISDGTNAAGFYGSGFGTPLGQTQGLMLRVMM